VRRDTGTLGKCPFTNMANMFSRATAFNQDISGKLDSTACAQRASPIPAAASRDT
jgi:hypothetical protein